MKRLFVRERPRQRRAPTNPLSRAPRSGGIGPKRPSPAGRRIHSLPTPRWPAKRFGSPARSSRRIPLRPLSRRISPLIPAWNERRPTSDTGERPVGPYPPTEGRRPNPSKHFINIYSILIVWLCSRSTDSSRFGPEHESASGRREAPPNGGAMAFGPAPPPSVARGAHTAVRPDITNTGSSVAHRYERRTA